MKINRTIRNISRYRHGGFRYTTRSLFFYKHSGELKKKYNNVVFWILLMDDYGSKIPLHHVMEISFYRLKARSVFEWSKMITEKTSPKTKAEKNRLARYGRSKHLSILDVINEQVLGSLNNRRLTHWQAVSVIGWTHGISKFRHSVVFSRNKTVTKKTRR